MTDQTEPTCPLGKDCDLTIAWLAGAENARDSMKARIEALEAERDRLREAFSSLYGAVSGEDGFAACVRADSGKPYPWPALDKAEAKALAALKGEGE